MRRSRLQRITVPMFFALLIGFTFLMLYLFFCERSEVYSTRDFHSAYTVQPEAEHIVSDPSAPAGIRREFTLTVPDTNANEDCLAFYLVHHYAQVWFDDELVYSLMPDTGNRIGNSPSSNWVILPLYPSDSGREITVILTPVYDSVVGRAVDFHIGPHYAIVMNQLKADMPQLILSVLCILMGLLLISAQFFLSSQKKASDWELFYLGVFTFLVGVWRISDTRSSPILFPQNPMLLGYITLGALFLAVTPLSLYMRTRYRGSEKPLLIITLVNCIFATGALVCQVWNLADLKEILPLNHIMMVMDTIALLWICLRHVRRGRDQAGTWPLILLLAAGFLIDLISFYIKKSSSGILYTIIALLVFSVYRFSAGVLSANRKAHTDLRTGLFNKNHWDELMRLPRDESDSIGIIMMDLNQLKHINDTMGHGAGDKMIHSFANILRNTIPATNTICRWGGDEFTVLIANASQEKLEQYVAAVANAASQYNASGGIPEIHYAAGWVLSSEFPELTTEELWAVADKRMYENKAQWHSVNRSGN